MSWANIRLSLFRLRLATSTSDRLLRATGHVGVAVLPHVVRSSRFDMDARSIDHFMARNIQNEALPSIICFKAKNMSFLANSVTMYLAILWPELLEKDCCYEVAG